MEIKTIDKVRIIKSCFIKIIGILVKRGCIMDKQIMKKNIVIYLGVILSLVIMRVLIYFMVDHLSFLVYYLVNLIVPIVILAVANAAIQFGTSNRLKSILIHSVTLGVVLLCVNLIANQFYGDEVFQKMSQKMLAQAEIPSAESLYEDAKEAMVEEGVISESDDVTIVPGEAVGDEQSVIVDNDMVTDGVIVDGAVAVPNAEGDNSPMVGEWDVQVVEESPLSVMTGIFVDIFFAFLGGIAGSKIYKNKNIDVKVMG